MNADPTQKQPPSPRKAPHSRVRRRSLFVRLTLLFVVILVAGLFWFAPDQSRQLLTEASTAAKKQIHRLTGSPPPATQPVPETQKKVRPEGTASTSPLPAKSLDTLAEEEREQPPHEAVVRLDRFYQRLDDQPWMRQFQLKTDSRTHFSTLIQKLLDNPPAVTQETDNLYTLLQNTAHFFRILGAENITLLKGILHHEKGNLEAVLADLYLLSEHPELLQKEYGISLNRDALRSYAAFLLDTMGGRLYLFRRDAESRMVVSWYAIKIIDESNRNGANPWGIDLRPAIDRLSDEIEHGGDRLRNRDLYLDELQQLKERYEQHPDGSGN